MIDKFPKTKEEARQKAIDWQKSVSVKNYSYGDMIEWDNYFNIIARKFNLVREFKENGII